MRDEKEMYVGEFLLIELQFARIELEVEPRDSV